MHSLGFGIVTERVPADIAYTQPDLMNILMIRYVIVSENVCDHEQ